MRAPSTADEGHEPTERSVTRRSHERIADPARAPHERAGAPRTDHHARSRVCRDGRWRRRATSISSLYLPRRSRSPRALRRSRAAAPATDPFRGEGRRARRATSTRVTHARLGSYLVLPRGLRRGGGAGITPPRGAPSYAAPRSRFLSANAGRNRDRARARRGARRSVGGGVGAPGGSGALRVPGRRGAPTGARRVSAEARPRGRCAGYWRPRRPPRPARGTRGGLGWGFISRCFSPLERFGRTRACGGPARVSRRRALADRHHADRARGRGPTVSRVRRGRPRAARHARHRRTPARP